MLSEGGERDSSRLVSYYMRGERGEKIGLVKDSALGPLKERERSEMELERDEVRTGREAESCLD